MEPRNDDELNDRELDRMLAEWKAPLAPARLRAAVFPDGYRPWWRTVWSASIRIPVPALALIAVLIAIVIWHWPAALSPALRQKVHELRPVAELRPVLIRSVE